MHPSFAQYMEECLYHPARGYYGSGKVRLRGKAHFWTYPQMLSPLFGRWMAELIGAVLRRWKEDGHLSPREPIRILELGAGEGVMARDVLDHIHEHRNDPAWAPFSHRILYECGEISPALLLRQRETLRDHIFAGRAGVRLQDARELRVATPFRGLVLCNELLDAFPCERLRIRGPGEVARLHLDLSKLGREGDPQGPEVLIPLEDGWLREDGTRGPPPPALTEYLAGMEPLVRDLAGSGLLPVDLVWQPALPSFLRGLGEILNAEGSLGAALLLDYGGTTRHILDPRVPTPHLRVYGPARERAHGTQVYEQAGGQDITCDVDFSEVARLAWGAGMDVRFFGPQSALALAGGSSWGEGAGAYQEEALDLMAEELARQVGFASEVARRLAPVLVKRFQRAPGYWLMVLGPGCVPFPLETLGPQLPLDRRALRGLILSVSPSDLRRTLGGEGLPEEIAEVLKPCGDIAADLSDHGLLHYHARVVEALERNGLLPPIAPAGGPGWDSGPERDRDS